ncbi:MAG: glycosyltransferase [Candidatus Methylumidiphilus sp.]
MKIVVFSPDMPYPPHRGGRADIWRRILAFRQLGHEVLLVSLCEASGPESPTKADFDFVDSVVNGRFTFPIKRGVFITIRQLAGSVHVPWHAASRIPNKEELQVLAGKLTGFQPDVLWLDGPWFGVIANLFSVRLGVPLLYRSHNIEYRYLRGQANAATKLRDRMAWALVCIGLQRFETRTMKQAIAAFDISVDDLQYWEGAGMQHMHWLPPLPELAFNDRSVDPISSDIVFLGNLGTPNNVRGVEWLVTEILPRVHACLPNVRCRIVGSNPTPFVSRVLAGATGVDLCANVPDPTPYLFGANVLVNPVMTGSGVQVKMLDMLMTDAPIVTASQGTRGLPHEFRGLFRIADDADAFAQAVCEELVASTVNVTARAAAREVFSVAAVGRALELVTQIMNAGRRG